MALAGCSEITIGGEVERIANIAYSVPVPEGVELVDCEDTEMFVMPAGRTALSEACGVVTSDDEGFAAVEAFASDVADEFGDAAFTWQCKREGPALTLCRRPLSEPKRTEAKGDSGPIAGAPIGPMLGVGW